MKHTPFDLSYNWTDHTEDACFLSYWFFISGNNCCWLWQAGVWFSTYHQVLSIMKQRNSPWVFPTFLTLVESCASVYMLRIRTKPACFPADYLSLRLQYGKHRKLVFEEFRSKLTSPGLDNTLAQRIFQTNISSPCQLQRRHVVRLENWLNSQTVRGSCGWCNGSAGKSACCISPITWD